MDGLLGLSSATELVEISIDIVTINGRLSCPVTVKTGKRQRER